MHCSVKAAKEFFEGKPEAAKARGHKHPSCCNIRSSGSWTGLRNIRKIWWEAGGICHAVMKNEEAPEDIETNKINSKDL